MKITAHFNSPDSADFAAGALKRTLSPLTKIETENQLEYDDNVSINIFPIFNLASITPTYSVPVCTPEADDKILKRDCVLKIICNKEEVSKASRIIVGFGGRNITII